MLIFASLSSDVFAKSSFSLSYSFTLDIHSVDQPGSLFPVGTSGLAGQALTS